MAAKSRSTNLCHLCHAAAMMMVALLSLSPTRAGAHDGEGEFKGGVAPDPATDGPYTPQNLELLSNLTVAQLGATSGSITANDSWGWTDPLTGDEYALVALTNQTSFVNVTDPTNPVYLGALPTHTGTSSWRDVKVYNNHALVVSDGNGNHGLQVFDLTTLRGLTGPPVTFAETAHYDGFGIGHNITINTDTGYAYVSGTNTFSGGLHIVDISDPANPTAAGGYAGDGYTHDTQVVTYHGPDTDYTGREIAFNFNPNQDTISIVDVTDKSASVRLAVNGYELSGYIHQGWLTADHRYLLSNDELDELVEPTVTNTRTHIWDMADLDNPDYIGFYEAPTASIDHNLYINGNTAYMANYTAGLRVVDISEIASGTLTEIASLDTKPADDNKTYNGAWSVYPYFDSGAIIVSDVNDGLFIVQHIPGDANRDGQVSVADLSILALNFNASGIWNTGDFTRDGLVTVADLSLLALNFGAGMVDPALGITFDQALDLVGLSPALLPEPTTAALVAMGVGSLSLRRRTRGEGHRRS